jgi:hypothetical protein
MSIFEYFRKRQKIILYTAGIFALISFSITGALLGTFDSLAGGRYEGPKMRLADGRLVRVQEEDMDVARALVNSRLAPSLMPSIWDQDRGAADHIEVLAALRRLAIESGIHGSDHEVQRAADAYLRLIRQWQQQQQQPANEELSVRDLAAQAGFGRSVGRYFDLMREMHRIGTFLRLQSLAVDVSDAEIAEQIARGLDVMTLKVATLDKKAIEAELKKTEVSDEDLQKWLDGLEDAEKMPYRDTNRVALKIAALRYDQFDPAAEEDLKGKEYSDQDLTNRYNLDREKLYRRPEPPKEAPPKEDGAKEDGAKEEQKAEEQGKAGEQEGKPDAQKAEEPKDEVEKDEQQDPYRPLEEVKDDVRKRLLAEDALRGVLDKVLAALAEHLRPEVAARTEALKVLAQARQAKSDADAAAAKDTNSEDLKQKATAAKTAEEQADQAHKAAEAAVDAKRATFDFAGEVQKLGKPWLVMSQVAEPVGADKLRDLPDGLGTWENAFAATSMDLAGDVSPRVFNTDKACFVFQVTALVKTPLKAFADIKDQLKEAYYKKKADEAAKESLDKFKDALKRLAREKRKEEIDKIEKDQAATVETKVAEWQTARTKEFEEAKAWRDRLANDPKSGAYQAWQRKFEGLEKDLGTIEDKRKAIETEVKAEVEEKVNAELRKAYADVLDQAAQETGLSVETLPAYPKTLNTRPRFYDSYPPEVRFLFSDPKVTGLAQGESTDILEDVTNRAHYLPVCVEVRKGTVADVTRRELSAQRETFAATRVAEALQQSFSIDAFRKRYAYQAPSDPAEAKSASG